MQPWLDSTSHERCFPKGRGLGRFQHLSQVKWFRQRWRNPGITIWQHRFDVQIFQIPNLQVYQLRHSSSLVTMPKFPNIFSGLHLCYNLCWWLKASVGPLQLQQWRSIGYCFELSDATSSTLLQLGCMILLSNVLLDVHWGNWSSNNSNFCFPEIPWRMKRFTCYASFDSLTVETLFLSAKNYKNKMQTKVAGFRRHLRTISQV